jgi:hypothetical protein
MFARRLKLCAINLDAVDLGDDTWLREHVIACGAGIVREIVNESR